MKYPLCVAAVVAAGLVGWWGLAANPAAAFNPPPVVVVHPHQPWEYKLLAYHPVLENMEKELNKAGADGWEAVAATGGPGQHVILKRPRR